MRKTRWTLHHQTAKPGADMLNSATEKPFWIRGKLNYDRQLANLERLVVGAPRTALDADRAAALVVSTVVTTDTRLPAASVPVTIKTTSLETPGRLGWEDRQARSMTRMSSCRRVPARDPRTRATQVTA